MPNYIKVKTGQSSWSTATKAYVKKSTGWVQPIRIWMKLLSGWTRIWPVSGPFALTSPFITSTSSGSTHIMPTTPLRIGTTYYGRNGTWDANGWTISSYKYEWRRYNLQFAGDDSGQTTRSSGTFSSPSIAYTPAGLDDKKYLSFYISPTTTDTLEMSEAESGDDDGRLFVIRRPPINILATLSADTKVGTEISYGSAWNVTSEYLPENSRTLIVWYRNTSATLTGATAIKVNLGSVAGAYTYTPVDADIGNYIIAKETTFNSGSDYADGYLTLGNTVGSGTPVGVSAVAITSSVIGAAPGNFTYSLTNVSSVTSPPTPIQQRVSAASNTVLIEINSAFPSDTESYELWSYGTGSLAGGTLANPAVQSITTLNQYNSSGNFVPTGGSFDTITSISSSASNSPISTFTKSVGTSRTLQFGVSNTTGALSWRINYTISGASTGNGTFALNTNSMPASITVSGASSPTVTINSITAYSSLNQEGGSTTGTAGSQTSLSTITKPTAFSTTSSSNYTFYVTPVIPTISIAANSGVSATAGTINWTSTNQASFSSTGTFSATGTTATSITNASLTASTTYTGTVTVTSSTGHTASANYSLTTSAPPTWTITWNANGGTGGGTTVQNRGVAHTAPSPGTREGFDFSSYRKPEFGGDPTFVASGGTFNPTANDSFWAQWTVKTYSVTFDANGGTGAPASQTKIHGTNLTLSATSPTRATVGSTQYAFAGWNTAANGSGTSYSAGATYTLNAPLSLFAQWTVTTLNWSISWNANGGTGGGTTTEPRGNSHTAPSPGTRSGFTFSQWRKPEFGGDPTFVANSGTFTPTANDSFWAQWTANPVTPTITMAANSGVSATAGTINWTSTNQASFSSTGTFSATGTTGTSISKTGLTASTAYTGTVTVTSSTGHTASANYSLTTSAAPLQAVVWGAMTAPAFSRGASSLRWGWNQQLPSSGDYNEANIQYFFQFSSSNATTTQSLSPTGLLASGTKPRRLGGGLTVGGATYDNRVSSQTSDYTVGYPAVSGEPVAYSASARYLRYRAVVVGSNGTTYTSNFSAWV
jgi:hypothetical protein